MRPQRWPKPMLRCGWVSMLSVLQAGSRYSRMRPSDTPLRQTVVASTSKCSLRPSANDFAFLMRRTCLDILFNALKGYSELQSGGATRSGFPLRNTGRLYPRATSGIAAVFAQGANNEESMTLGLWKPPLWVTPLPEEPPHGMYLRLAERNGLRHIRVFENMTGVKLRHVRLGRDLDYLAAILRCEPHQLSEYSIEQGRRGSLIIRGEAVRRKDVMMVQRRACPACFAISAHHRFWWDLRFVTTCPMHAIRLANCCSCGGKLTWTDGSLTKCHTCEHGDVRLLPGEFAPYDVGSLDRWILSRFGIVDYKEKVPVIHKQPLGTAIEIVERIGALVVGGYRTHWQQITDYSQPPEEVRAIGFRTLAEGKLAGALDRAYDGFLVSTHKAAGISTMYGWFSYWFCHRGGPRLSTELADIMLKHAQGKAQVSRLAFPSLSRSNDSITLNEASRMCRVRPGTLRKSLAAENLIRPDKRKGCPVMIPFKIAKRMAYDLATSVNLRGVAEIVGVRGVALVKLSRSGSIPAWVRVAM